MKSGDAKPSGTTGQAPSSAGQKSSSDTKASSDMKASDSKASDSKASDSKMKSSSDMKSDDKAGKSAADSKSKDKSASDANKNDATKGAASTNDKSKDSAQGASSSTTGQGAAAGRANLSTEQKTKIQTTFKSVKIQSVPKTEINVSISVGTRLPPKLHYTPIPAEVVTVYPQWRGYYVILVDGQYIIVEPRTHEIVYILV